MSDKLPLQNTGSMSIILCGQAGQGIQTVEYLLTRILKLVGYNVFATKEFMSRIRGGINSTEIRVSAKKVSAFVDRIDILIALNKGAIRHVEKRISPQTIILAEKENLSDDFDQTRHRFVDVPFTKIASDIGNRVYSNVVAVGTLAGLFGIQLQTVTKYVKQFFSAKSKDVVQKNLAAVKEGFNLGAGLVSSSNIKISVGKDSTVNNQILLSGAEAISLGAIAVGCNFIYAYPISHRCSSFGREIQPLQLNISSNENGFILIKA